MSFPEYHIALMNIAILKYPIDDPRVADFVNNLDRINIIADNSEGFVWRLQDESGNATAINAYDDPNIIVNLTVWKNIDDLFKFTYASDHVDIFRRKSEWFEKPIKAHLALWWVEKGYIPTPEEGKAKLEYLEKHGPSNKAFTFKTRFEPESD